jgi:hypothetical protein
LKGSFLGVGIFGILLILFGIVFALQGSGMIGGSAMTGNPFWIYAGSGIAIFGVILTSFGFYIGSRHKTPQTVARDEKGKATNAGGVSTSDSAAQERESNKA